MRIRPDAIGWSTPAWEVVDDLAAPLPRRAALTGIRPSSFERIPLAGLDGLSIANARLTAADLLPLARRDETAPILALRLAGNAIDRDGLARLIATPLFDGLEELELDDNPIGPDGLSLITNGVPTLRKLVLANTRLDATSTASPMPHLRWLDVARNPIGSAALASLVHSLSAPLDAVDLSTTNLDAALALEVVALGLGRNPLAGPAIARILEGSPRLAWLDAGWTREGNAWITSVPRTVRTLWAENAEIDDLGAIALASTPRPAIERIGFVNNAIGDLGAYALADWHAPALVDCDLRGNQVTAATERSIRATSSRLRFQELVDP